MTPLTTVGWREWLALPGLGIAAIKAKIDTGARTSALHAFDLEPYQRRGHQRLRFGVHPFQGRDDVAVACDALLVDRRCVRDSGGRSHTRWVIVTPVALQGEPWPIEITLTDRSAMGFRMLLGRTAVAGRCLVDPRGSFLASRPPATPSVISPSTAPPSSRTGVKP
ncbi:MAG: ATP-dependent zinc protease [Candidatus Competibacterales bacterium]